jgi:hypothetical protein
VPHVVDPGPWIRHRIAEETAPLRAELAAAATRSERVRLRWRIWRTGIRLRRTFGGAGPVKF